MLEHVRQLGVVLLLVLWRFAPNPKADRIMCAETEKLPERDEGFGARAPLRLLKMPASHGIVRILVHQENGLEGRLLGGFATRDVVVLGVKRADGTFVSLPDPAEETRLGDEIFVYGPDDKLDTFHKAERNGERA